MLYFTLLPTPPPPFGRIYTKFGIGVLVVDVIITIAKFVEIG